MTAVDNTLLNKAHKSSIYQSLLLIHSQFLHFEILYTTLKVKLATSSMILQSPPISHPMSKYFTVVRNMRTEKIIGQSF